MYPPSLSDLVNSGNAAARYTGGQPTDALDSTHDGVHMGDCDVPSDPRQRHILANGCARVTPRYPTSTKGGTHLCKMSSENLGIVDVFKRLHSVGLSYSAYAILSWMRLKRTSMSSASLIRYPATG